jgi:hypothetical protein
MKLCSHFFSIPALNDTIRVHLWIISQATGSWLEKFVSGFAFQVKFKGRSKEINSDKVISGVMIYLKLD